MCLLLTFTQSVDVVTDDPVSVVLGIWSLTLCCPWWLMLSHGFEKEQQSNYLQIINIPIAGTECCTVTSVTCMKRFRKLDEWKLFSRVLHVSVAFVAVECLLACKTSEISHVLKTLVFLKCNSGSRIWPVQQTHWTARFERQSQVTSTV